VTGKREIGLAIAIAACAACLVVPAFASAVDPQFLSTDSVLTGTTIRLKGDAEPEVLSRVMIAGRVPVPGPGQAVTVKISREGEEISSREVPTDPATGVYKTRLKLSGCCEYTAQAGEGSDISDPLSWEVHGPATLEPGKATLRFNKLLAKNGFHMGEITDTFDESTGLAILAMRKTNELPLSETYAPELYTMLLRGDSRFQPVHDEPGRHVEVDISRQVMALVEDGKAAHVFHVSTGAGGTPRGDFNFYEKSPGYNAKGMYYSVYYSGNYATHGYYTVPYYPASHGCVRNPETYSVFIYNWISLGDPMYVYD
jgi:hypothetical protein